VADEAAGYVPEAEKRALLQVCGRPLGPACCVRGRCEAV